VIRASGPVSVRARSKAAYTIERRHVTLLSVTLSPCRPTSPDHPPGV
jgi:hypothetical protein